MTAQTTQVNYTEAQTAQMVQDYVAGATVDSIAEALGKSVRSVVAKLSREGVYKAKSKAKSEARVTKADLIKNIAYQCGVEAEVLASLEKASMEALRTVHDKLM